MARKPKWPADKVERRKVADLAPYARNARTHSEAQIAQLVASIRETNIEQYANEPHGCGHCAQSAEHGRPCPGHAQPQERAQ